MTAPNWPPCWTASGSDGLVGGDDPARGQTGSSRTRATAIPAVGCRGHARSRTRSQSGAIYARRNVVERCITQLKQWRGLATRYGKRAVNYRAMVVIASMVIWLAL